jgi:hypothetical protein
VTIRETGETIHKSIAWLSKQKLKLCRCKYKYRYYIKSIRYYKSKIYLTLISSPNFPLVKLLHTEPKRKKALVPYLPSVSNTVRACFFFHRTFFVSNKLEAAMISCCPNAGELFLISVRCCKSLNFLLFLVLLY